MIPQYGVILKIQNRCKNIGTKFETDIEHFKGQYWYEGLPILRENSYMTPRNVQLVYDVKWQLKTI